MFVITVTFGIKPDHVEEFQTAVLAQARNSLEREADCHRFDVCFDDTDPGRVFLYEVYSDEAAFKAHLESRHFKDFDTTVEGWLDGKDVDVWRLG